MDTSPSIRPDSHIRYCAMRDFDSLIVADGGRWDEVEIPGNRAIVKVVASQATLSTINAAPGFVRVPKDRLDDPLSTLSAAQRTAIKNQILNAGYTLSEVNTAFPDLSVVTIGDVLRFMASRRLQPRYDIATNTIICDGPIRKWLS